MKPFEFDTIIPRLDERHEMWTRLMAEPGYGPYLHEDEVESLAPVTVFETGTNRWRSFDKWPPSEEQLCIYLQPEGNIAFSPPVDELSFTEFVSDPAKPVPYEPRPNWAPVYSNPPAIAEWRRWLVEDQRFVDGRPDVATWVSEPLSESLTVRGPVIAQLFAETTGTDADWVVKFIDVYPDDDPTFEMSGHRLMVQVQSTWFPLYDRNPQTFVPTIMSAPPDAYKTTIRSLTNLCSRLTNSSQTFMASDPKYWPIFQVR